MVLNDFFLLFKRIKTDIPEGFCNVNGTGNIQAHVASPCDFM